MLKGLRGHTKILFFTVGLIFILVGLSLTQMKGFGEEVFIQLRPRAGIRGTATQPLGYLLICVGLLSWMAAVGSIVVSSEES